MTSYPAMSRRQPARRSALMHSVSLGALVVAGGGLLGSAQAAPLRSLSQALAMASHAAQQAVAPANAVTASKQAALGARNLAAAATRLRSLSDALAAAGNTAGGIAPGSPLVVDGFGPGTGLQVAPGTLAGGTHWQGATLPSSATTAGGITVNVKQSQPLAQLTWSSFNVGRRTTLNFDQSAGGSQARSWTVINTVQDPLANPSQILGAITAQGKVFVLDRNGIAFGRGATINVGSLVAATADIAATQFATTASGVTSFNLFGAQVASTDAVTGLTLAYQPTFVNGTAAAITVAPGATIQTASGGTAGGYAMLLGGNVANAGIINTPQGQAVLAAGTAFTLRQGSQGSVTTGNLTSTTIGAEVAATNYGTSTTSGFLSNVPINITFSTGAVANAGIVLADQGDISLVGHTVTQSGVLMATTTVNHRGTIHLLTPNDGSDQESGITLAPGSLTEILPEDNGLTALDSQRAANVAGSLVLNTYRSTTGLTAPKLNDTSLMADQLGESRVELSSGGAIDVGAGALVVAQGGQVAVGGGSKVVIEAGANLDVSGTTNALLPASANDLLVNVQPFQLRDSAANRTGGLKSTNVYVDAATLVQIASGSYAGNIYTPGGLIEVAGYLGLVPHGIAEWTAIGGQVTLQAAQLQLDASNKPTTVAGAVITQPGAAINLQGGTVSVQAGPVKQSYVRSADGTVYNVNTAPGNLVYTGLYTGTTVAHPRWHITDTFNNPLLTPGTIEQAGYAIGRDAGSLTINAATAVLQGSVFAGVTLGQSQQGARPAGITDPYLLAQTVVPQAGSLALGNIVTGVLQTLTTPTQIVFQATNGAGASGTGTIAAPVIDTAIIDAPMLDAGGFASIVASTGGNIAVNAPLTVANGGTIALTGANITVNADLTARSGAITLTDQLASTHLPVAPTTSITLAPGARLDTRGVWTNGKTGPGSLVGLGSVNGGTVTIAGAAGVALQAGSTVDVSSGGAVLASGRQVTGRGGSVTIVADQDLVAGTGLLNLFPVTVASTIVGYGSAGGGTFSLTAPEIRIGGAGPGPFITLPLDPALFATGFARYAIDGTAQLSVAPGTQLSVAQPIYQLSQGFAVPTGGDPAAAYSVVLPALYTPTRSTDVLTQRAGASLVLSSSVGPNSAAGGPLTIGAGATISVDPGQAIALAGYGQVSVFGTLIAHGGTVQVANTSYGLDQTSINAAPVVSAFQSGTSVWIDAASRIDVSGQAVVQTDSQGRNFGIAPSGGSILLGSVGASTPTLAEVIVRPGAILDADGAAARVDVVPQTTDGLLPLQSRPVELVGNGGTIAAESAIGLALDGTLLAHAGGPGAAGGGLQLTLDAINLAQFTNIPTAVYQPRQILVTEATVPVLTQPALQPGQPLAAGYGTARLSQQEIDAGGFDAVALSAQSAAIVFDGKVDLHTGSSIVLGAGVIGTTAPTGSVSIAAPYVSLIGENAQVLSDNGVPILPAAPTQARLTVQADLLDLSETLYFGGGQTVSPVAPSTTGTSSTGTSSTGTSSTGSVTAAAPSAFGGPPQGVVTTAFGFAQTNFDSSGDIRLLGSPSAGTGTLLSQGNIAFEASQLYPAGGQKMQVIAGANPLVGSGKPVSIGGTILITSNASPAQPPYSVGGGLEFSAGTVIQAGTVRAPEGTLAFDDGAGANFTSYAPSRISFLPGSVTSVSLAGQVIPFGGTLDGVSYAAPGGGTPPLFTPTVTLGAQSVTVMEGATIDLRGGGTLAGAGFIFGRGGSADVLTTPLLDLAGGAIIANAASPTQAVQPARSGDPVYAILPGYQSAYAPPAGAEDGATTPTRIGAQITVQAGQVAGLAAGTYTLLPAIDALLPGGYRVELASGTLPLGTALAQGNFTTAAAVTLSVANTTIRNPVPSLALFTSGAGVRQLSQYDEESYNAFEAAAATQFGAPRPFLPQDAKTLDLNYYSLSPTLTALSVAPSALLASPAPGGYGATLEVNSTLPIAITGPADVAPAGDLAIAAGVLSALDVPRLVMGGTLSVNATASTTIDVNALAPSVDVAPHAVLTGGDVLITTAASGQITVEPGARISTLGQVPAAYDAANGFLFNTEYGTGTAYPALDVSNGRVVFRPNTDVAAGAAISIGDGAALLAGGSLNVVAPSSTVVTIGNADLRAPIAAIAVASINIGNATDLAGQATTLPSGLNLTPASFLALLNVGQGAAAGAGTQLTLTATQEVNLLGSFTLDTRTPTGPGGALQSVTDLVLNTPAIYGVGTATDAVSIFLGNFTWSGVATSAPASLSASGSSIVSALPGGRIAASLAQSSGALSISAGTIVLGYGPQTQPNNQVVLGRLVGGFDTVSLTGTSEITANNKSALSVFGTQTVVGQPGTGGNLTLTTPLLTTDSGAVLNLTAGGTLSVAAPSGATPAATAPVATLGGQIDLAAGSITIATALALPAGQLTATAQGGIDVGAAGTIDLSGRTVSFFEQTRAAPGGTLAFESTAGSITLDPGSVLDVGAQNAAAGSIAFNALSGTVALDGTLLGNAGVGQAGGSFTVLAGTLASALQAANLAAGASAFAEVNAALNTGGFIASRSFEFSTDVGPSKAASTDIFIGNDTAGHALLAASAVSVTADAGSVTVAGTIDASGTGPGAIRLAATGDLTLEAGAVLDAHANRTATDSYGQPIDAENRAHVTLTTTAGTLHLLGGQVDLGYPGQAGPGTPQGQLVLNAPRVGSDDVAIDAAAPLQISGAQSVALYAWRTYLAQDRNGTVAQIYGGHSRTAASPILALAAIDADSQRFMTAAGANTALAGRLAGLATLGTTFHLRPGVEIDSTAASGGNITITGDVDLSGYRYSDVGYGQAVTQGVASSGEAGALRFRASNDLIVNGSVTDGFAAPPDIRANNYLPADAGWLIVAPPIASGNAGPDALNADILLPSSLTISRTLRGQTEVVHKVELVAGTTFSEARAIALNYAITIASASVSPNQVIPFAATIDPAGSGLVVPQGGFVTTAALTSPAGVLIPAGTFLAGGTVIAPGSTFGAGSIFPVAVQVATGTVVPAGTLLSLFNDPGSTLTLSKRTGGLPDNALLPSNTVPQFATVDGRAVYRLDLRPVRLDANGKPVQGALYALGDLLPAGTQSWNLDFVAGANQASANTASVLPRSVLDGGALAAPANTPNQAPGSLLLDDQHALAVSTNIVNVNQDNPAFSVIRTGTGDLSLVAGGNFDQSSLFGIYTAGAQDPLAGGPAANAPYDLAREGINGSRFVTGGGAGTAINRAISATYQANYPSGGGDVLVAAQGSVTGDVFGGNYLASGLLPSDAVGNWLWRQGSTQLGQPGAWWINFGTFVQVYAAQDQGYQNISTPNVQLTGFQGIGALGGGNVSITVGTDAGQITDRQGANLPTLDRGEGLVVAVGSTGRVVSSGGTQTLVETGGGNLTLHVAGTLNPIDAAAFGLTSPISTVNGSLIDLRGNISVAAGAIGRLDPTYPGGLPAGDPRPANPSTPTLVAADGLTLIPGDGTVSVQTQRDLVIAAVADAGRVTEQNQTAVSVSQAGSLSSTGGVSGFTLWSAATAVSLQSAGGNITPVYEQALVSSIGAYGYYNGAPTDFRTVYPSQLYVTALARDIVYGTPGTTNAVSLEIAPSANEQVAFLASGSIQANGMAVDLSGANPQSLPTPFAPAFSTDIALQASALTNVRGGGATAQTPFALFAFEPDTPTTPYLSTASAAAPALFYAQGDILNFITGETLLFGATDNEALPAWYLAGKPVRIMAGNDIVSSGTRPSAAADPLQQNTQATASPGNAGSFNASGNVFLNANANSVSLVSAGRDILSSYFYVGGPGLLEVDAGRNLDQVGFSQNVNGAANQLLAYGSIKSLGSLQSGAPISLTGGAGITVTAGLGQGADYAAFARLYLDPAEQANLSLPITDAANKGKVQQVYSAELLAYLQQGYGYTGTAAGALAWFLDPAHVPQANQDAFLRGIFFGELLASGRQYNDPTSRFHLSYARGRQAIDALLPGNGAVTTNGVPAGYVGGITMASGPIAGVGQLDAGIATEHGGDVQVITPGGPLVLGTSGGTSPGAGTGIVTNGFGNIAVFSGGSDLLGKSRVFTNAGGNIQIWSALGDINAGIGARTTVVFNPPVISYDNTGGLVETPAVPTSGAGIATEQPLPAIPAGNIDLTAPLGTIDAGEAGVRSSGNLNLVAARLANTAGFSAGGKTSGNSAAPSFSLGAAEAAGAAAGAGQQAAQNLSGAHTEGQLPSIIEVEVLGLSGETDEQRRKKRGG